MYLPPLPAHQKRVVIIGGGFAGIELAKKLDARYFQVILLDKNNYHQFQPLLYQVATSGLEPSSISFPLRKIFQRRSHVFIRIAEVQAVDTTQKIVHTSIGTTNYDYLVVAHGATTNFFKNTNIERNAFSMKSVGEALLLRNTLLQNYEKALVVDSADERDALLNVVLVGGGPTGVELAGAIAEMRNKILPKDYSELNFKEMDIYLVEAGAELLGAMSPTSSDTVEKYLTEMGVILRKNTAVKDYDGTNVLLSDGTTLRSKCLIWAAGVKGQFMKGIAPQSFAPNDRIYVNEWNEVKDTPHVFAIGDAAAMILPDYPRGHPQVAPVAIQQADLLADNLRALALGNMPTAFVYKDKGSMATVGKNKAVAEIGKTKLKGFIAWLIWMVVHLMSLVGVKNKIFVVYNWIWQYFTYDPSLRLIILSATRNATLDAPKFAQPIGAPATTSATVNTGA